MLNYDLLRELILRVLREMLQSGTTETNFLDIVSQVARIAKNDNHFPNKQACTSARVDFSYYEQGQLNPIDVEKVNSLVWDLIFERVLNVGVGTQYSSTREWAWPGLRITEFGKESLTQHVLYYDPFQYLDQIKTLIAPSPLDPGTAQYLSEGLNAYHRGLYFASTVMLGAAAEKFTLSLMQAIHDATQNTAQKATRAQLINQGRMPAIFSEIEQVAQSLSGQIPYSVHQGRVRHLLSWQEMVRVYRNQAVHPATGVAFQRTIFLAIQGFPGALETVYKLTAWFKNNQI